MLNWMNLRRLLCLIFLVIPNISEAKTIIKCTKFECEPNPKFFDNLSCSLTAVNRYKNVGNVEAHIRKSLRNITANIALYSRNRNLGYRPFLVNTTINACDCLDKKPCGFYGKVMVDILSTFTNINHSCPLSGLALAKDLYIDPALLRVPTAIIPRRSYKLALTLYEGYPLEVVSVINFYGDIVEQI